MAYRLRQALNTMEGLMGGRITIIERAFALAASGRMTSIKDVRTTLKSEGYADDGQLYGRSIREQLTKLIVECGNRARE